MSEEFCSWKNLLRSVEPGRCRNIDSDQVEYADERRRAEGSVRSKAAGRRVALLRSEPYLPASDNRGPMVQRVPVRKLPGAGRIRRVRGIEVYQQRDSRGPGVSTAAVAGGSLAERNGASAARPCHAESRLEWVTSAIGRCQPENCVRHLLNILWRSDGEHETEEGSETEHQESRSGREEETNDRPSAEVREDGAGKTGRESGAAETKRVNRAARAR